MNYELDKSEFIKLKKEELEYINTIAKISSIKTLSESEKLKIYRTLNNYEIKLSKIANKVWDIFPKKDNLTKNNLKDVIIEIDLKKDYLSSLKFNNFEEKKYVLEKLWIDIKSLKFKLTLYNLMRYKECSSIDPDRIQNNQKLIEKPIYIFLGYYDSSEECYGPCFLKPEDYIYGTYQNIDSKYNDKKEISKKEINEFEKDKIIIYSKPYVYSYEIKEIFKNELLDSRNQTLNDCITQTKNKIKELNYSRSPECKEKILLDKINELYKKVNNKFILTNETMSKYENIKINNIKDFVVVIATTIEKEYIITIQKGIKNKLIEFPSGYIKNNEDPKEAAKRNLKEKTGYISDDLFIVDEAYTFLNTDDSKTYIVIANNCIKQDKVSNNFIEYELFSENELEYLINKNIMNGAINKLAYYNLINNVDNYNITYEKSIKKLRKKRNPLDN